MPYFSRFLHRLTVCVLAFVGMFAVNSCLAAYTVNYLCGDGTGETPDNATNIQTGADFVPAANTCTTPENYEFDGWSVSGTNEVVPASTSFTWEYTENKFFIAHYTKTPCSAGQSWETYTCDLSDAPVTQIGGSFGGRAINGATGSDYTKPLNNFQLTKGEWGSVLGDYTIKGRAFCSNKAGNNLTLSFPEGYDWLANDSELIAAGTGEYCWCKITEYTSSSLQCDNIESDWVFINQNSSCSSICAVYCAYKFYTSPEEGSTRGAFRRELYNAVTRAEQEKCEINANLHYITYSNLLDATWDENQLHPDSYITGEEITIGIPTREGYVFDGWCNDSTLTQNCTKRKIISASSSADLTFYAKWREVSCPAGYHIQQNPFSNMDGQASPTGWAAYNYASSAIVPTSGYVGPTDIPNNRWNMYFKNWNDPSHDIHMNGLLHGEVFCSASTGTNIDLTTTGDACWCHADGFTPKSGGLISFDGPWFKVYSGLPCNQECPAACMNKLHTQTQARLDFYNVSDCVLSVYSIEYDIPVDASFQVPENIPTSYTINDSSITLPTPSREGCTFAGWCDDSVLTQNCTTEKVIPAGSTGDKTFYAKWVAAVCAAGYHEQTNPFNENDYLAPVSERAYQNVNENITGYEIPNGRWAASFNYDDNANNMNIHMNGVLYGQTFCASTGADHFERTQYSFQTSSNIDQSQHGSYCWCRIDGFTPTGGQLINVTGNWVALGKMYSQDTCENNLCASKCSDIIISNVNLRKALYGSLPECVPDTPVMYYITYDNMLNATWEDGQNHPASYTTGNTIELGSPTREGYAFVAWCDDVELQENCSSTKTILSTDTGDKTFYAKWAALPCGAGYESQTSPFNDTDYKASAVAYAYFDSVNGNPALVAFRGRDNEVNVDLDDSLETLPVGRYELFFKEGAEGVSFYGMLYGRAQCSTTLGYTGNWMFSGHGQSVPDTISETPGNYCWCQLDGFTPYTKSGTKWIPSGERSNFLTKWMSPGGTTCTPYSCAKFCVEKIGYQLPERQVMYGPGALPPCKIKTYTISYELDGGEWPIALVSKPETYNITSATINLPTPAEREGYTFDGWYDNNSFTGGAITQIPSGSYGKKTFYAKWKANVVEPVEPVEPDTEQEPTPVAEPDECALASCVVTIDFGNGQTIEETFINGDDLVMPVQEESAGLVFNGYCEGTPTCTEPQMRLTTEQIENGATVYPQYIPVSPETTAPSVEERTCPNDACEVVLNYDDSTESSGNIDLNSGSNPRSASALRRGGILRTATTDRSARTFNRGELLITPMLVKQGYTLAGYCIGETDTCSAPIAAVSNINLNTKSRVTITPKWNRSSSSPQPNPMDPDCTSHAWLHVGDTKACLSTTKFEKPVLGIKTKKGTYYLKASTDYALPMSKNTNRKLRVGNNGIIYNIHDGLVSE